MCDNDIKKYITWKIRNDDSVRNTQIGKEKWLRGTIIITCIKICGIEFTSDLNACSVVNAAQCCYYISVVVKHLGEIVKYAF